MKQEERQRVRLVLGHKAIAIASAVAGSDTITQDHLEEAIDRLERRQARSDQQLFLEQLQMINENLIRLRHMVAALAASTDEEVHMVVAKLVTDLGNRQIEKASDAMLDVPGLVALQDRAAAQLAIEELRESKIAKVESELDL
ncbi:hypothetical protein EU803_15830 [Loktanella sp. IMCC34160]|uniref:hypothetical protein n=1 Tax=Loktanella sp. IMCC34160 TaxID=2510646 RepID=UPI00101D477A|nr:hypothetical protein [Loktanella sp. IMCC34160]RYG90080.1 hypothetical protein EU803_15830 [Loktanella sp. IMCC34160]